MRASTGECLKSRYRVLLAHLLKWRFQPGLRGHSWRVTIRRERETEIPDHLAENPGLKPRRHELFQAAYDGARLDAILETGLPEETFPETCPFSLDQAMDKDFWPQMNGDG